MPQLKEFTSILSGLPHKTLRFFTIVLLGCIGFSLLINFGPAKTVSAQQVIGDGVLVAPIEVKLGGRVRSGLVTVQNKAPERTSYRISVVGPLEMDEGIDASKWIRFSPRKITLDPGEIQKVRVLVRKPKDAPKGKYLARLLVRAIPPELEVKKEQEPTENVSVEIVIVYGVTIPIRIDNT